MTPKGRGRSDVPQVAATVAGYASAALYGAGPAVQGVAFSVAYNATMLAISYGINYAAIELTGGRSNTSPLGTTVTSRGALAARRVIYGERRVGGTILDVQSVGLTNPYIYLVIGFAGHEVEDITTVFADDEELTLDGSGYVTSPSEWTTDYFVVKKFYGTETQDVGSIIRGLAVAGFDTPAWTGLHRLRGVAGLVVRLRWHDDKWPTGLPNISAIVKGRKVYDSRVGGHDPDDYSTWAYSSNPALCTADYLRGVPILDGTGALVNYYGVGAPSADINGSDLTAAANICDENVTLASGGTENRFECHCVFDSDRTPDDMLPNLLGSMAGKASWSGGQWRINAGAYTAPTETLTEDDLRGAIKVQVKRSRRDLFNSVRGVFISSQSLTNSTPADFPPVQTAAGITEDNDEEIWTDIQLQCTKSPSMAQRIGKIVLNECRQQIVVQWPCTLRGMQWKVGDTVAVTLARRGWSAKPFFIASSTLAYDTGENGLPVLGVDLTLQETASSVYSWAEAADENTFDAGASSNLPSARSVQQPSAPTIVESLYDTRTPSGVKTRATVSWTQSSDPFLANEHMRWKLASASSYSEVGAFKNAYFEINDIAAGTYDFEVAAVNTSNVQSSWATTQHTIVGLGAVPSALTGLNVQVGQGAAGLSWDVSTDLDVKIGGTIQIRHSTLTTGATWALGTSIGDAVPGGSTQLMLPLKPGSYMIRPLDSSGIPGAETVYYVTGADIDALSTDATVTEQTSFAGGNTNTESPASVLQLTNTAGNVDASGTYTFANAMNFGSSLTKRIETVVTSTVVNINALIDSRLAYIDTWESFDGDATGSEADAWVEMRTAPDNVPTWGGWSRLDNSIITAWHIQFRAQLRSTDTAYNISISALSATAKS
jgi:hypothetical protein